MLARTLTSAASVLRFGILGILCFIVVLRPAAADMVVFRGKVVMEDGSPPGRSVSIQRTCQGMDHVLVEGTVSQKTGEYFVRLDVGDFGTVYSGYGLLPCLLEAVASGYVSTKLDLTDRRLTMNPRFPDIVLTRATAGVALDFDAGPGV